MTEYFKNKTGKDGLMTFCKECKRKKNNKWAETNRERHQEMKRDWYGRNRESKLAANTKWREANRDKMNFYVREYAKKNPAKRNLWGSMRRARLRNAMPLWVNKKDLLPFYEEAQRISKETGIPHHVDHIIPLCAVNEEGERIASGLHVPWNLQVITAEENIIKSNIIPTQIK